jgi:chromosomal replication initiation ATPase DnaA
VSTVELTEEEMSLAADRALDSRPEQILREVAFRHGIDVAAIIGPDRYEEIVAARHEAAFEIRARCRLSTPGIGRLLNRDHQTIIHAIRKVAAVRPKDIDPALACRKRTA